MIRVGVQELQNGDCLALSVPNPGEYDKVLLVKGCRLNDRTIRYLRHVGFRSVWIECAGSEALGSLVTETQVEVFRTIFKRLAKTFKRLCEGGLKPDEFARYRMIVLAMFSLARENTLPYLRFDDFFANSTNTEIHSAHTCFFSIQIGLRLYKDIFGKGSVRKKPNEVTPEDFIKLGLGALFHDIGKYLIDPAVLAKEEWELNAAELNIFRSHSEKGYQLLKPQVGNFAANIARRHHICMDGTGYPSLIEGSDGLETLSESERKCCEIVAVVNAFDDLVCRFKYSEAAALEEIFCARAHQFSEMALKGLKEFVPPFPVGTQIKLETGHYAVVLENNEKKIFRPDILMLKDPLGKILPESQRVRIELSKYSRARIAGYVSQSVIHLFDDRTQNIWEDVE